ncbi:hypothetical protein NIES4074_47190 [Cylindrospermum sp. NIES-4074]|nr:hypothetical protein NIES4074_47190 [Cylindrospermum sp. NIES-4074]
MSTLKKAELICYENRSLSIKFMFNPTEIKFTRQLNYNPSEGARTDQGLNKVNFANPAPCTLDISNIIIDTYEKGSSVTPHIQKFLKSVRFVKGLQRPPIYLFTWGKQTYLRCFVQNLGYSLTMFLPDGTPVRATVNLSLKEIDLRNTGSIGTPAVEAAMRIANARPAQSS